MSKEVIVKAAFYTLLAMIVSIYDQLGTMEDVTWSVEAARGLILFPIMQGMLALKAFMSQSYGKDQEEREKNHE